MCLCVQSAGLAVRERASRTARSAQPRKLNLGRVCALLHATVVAHESDSNNPPTKQLTKLITVITRRLSNWCSEMMESS